MIFSEQDWPEDPFEKALAAEPNLRAIDYMVRALVAMAPKREPFCADCIWGAILKPLVSPWVGWERGYIPKSVEDKQVSRILSTDDMFDIEDKYTEATTLTEKWLRSTEAFDLVTDKWLAMLNEADPAQGCGYPRSSK